MSRFVPWALVALCFVLGVASRSISDTFVVFVAPLQSAFEASRSAVTLIYSFALLVGGIAAPISGWIVDRFGLRMLTTIGMSAAALATLSASFATEIWHLYVALGIVMGFASATPRRCAGNQRPSNEALSTPASEAPAKPMTMPSAT